MIDPQGHGSGGLALFWKQNINLNVTDSCKNFINADICYENKSFRASFVYGDPEPAKRCEVWSKLTQLTLENEEPWFLIGDFNDIINNQEKTGGRERSEGSLADFRTFLAECDLYDLPILVIIYHGGEYEVMMLCGADWTELWQTASGFDLFHSGSVEYLKYEGSDHRPIVACFDLTKKKGK